jgi:fructose-1,6-bisphosphatase/inositol monophosphatase family enzyme
VQSSPPRLYGPLNAHVVGTLMKEAVRRAIVAIRGQRFTFEATVKGPILGSDGSQDPAAAGGSQDMVTSADHAAQRVYVKLLREWFPTFGIVAEEEGLAVPCTHPEHDVWFTVDPLDGTKAFIRRQSHGVGTMISLVCDGEVVAACIGDVMTQEVYALRPDGDQVHRISEFGVAESLAVDPARPLSRQYMLLRGSPQSYSPAVQAAVRHQGGLVRGYENMGGSIGTGVARLWKGEMGVAIITAGHLTPWDGCPLLAPCRVLDFAFVHLRPDGEVLPVDLPPHREGIPLAQETWVVHRSRLDEVRTWWTAASRPTSTSPA